MCYLTSCMWNFLPKVLELFSIREQELYRDLIPLPCLCVSDSCLFGSESGLPVCSHMLFYPAVASCFVAQPSSLPPPPVSLSFLGVPSFCSVPPCWFSLPSCPPPSVCQSLSARRLPWPLPASWGRELFGSSLPWSLIPPSFSPYPSLFPCRASCQVGCCHPSGVSRMPPDVFSDSAKLILFLFYRLSQN